jgi:hypothetical protein
VSLLLELESGRSACAPEAARRDRRGIVVVVGLLDRGRTLSNRTVQQAIERLAGRIMAYGGTVHCRGNRLRLVLHESLAGTAAAFASPA